MAKTGVPDAGELRLGRIALPAGKQVIANYGSGAPVAWATVSKVPGAGRAWSALSDAHQETGLVPFLLSGLHGGSTERPWDLGEFGDIEDVTLIDQLDPERLLREQWDGETHEEGIAEEDEDEDFRDYLQEKVGPFGRQFPGLAPAEDRQLSSEVLQDVLGALPDARIGLTPAARPADVLPLIGWEGAVNSTTSLPIAAVLRSWEDRFGARLLDIGFAEIRLLVSRPPRTIGAAQRIAAEHVVFCDECGGQGLTEVSTIAASLLESPVWTFWWD